MAPRLVVHQNVLPFARTRIVGDPAFSVCDPSSSHGIILHCPAAVCSPGRARCATRLRSADRVRDASRLWCACRVLAIVLLLRSQHLASPWRVSYWTMPLHLPITQRLDSWVRVLHLELTLLDVVRGPDAFIMALVLVLLPRAKKTWST